ncbi:MAG: chorismate synthase [Bacteroidales bacterium]|nr:chorismate synthase [Bacteroidales bacterium]
MNSFGQFFKVTIFGESHGPAIGVTLDGVPENIELYEEDFEEDIARRAPGRKGTTARKEADRARILSGVYNGYTTGSPLTIIFWNSNVEGRDYLQFDDIPRPGHADLVANIKYNFANDPRGGGHFSGRLTLPIVAAGVVAKKILSSQFNPEPLPEGAPESTYEVGEREGIDFSKLPQARMQAAEEQIERRDVTIHAELLEIGGERDSSKWDDLLDKTAKEGDSLGGIIECRVEGLPIGFGEPFWDSMESLLSHAMFSIPGIRGIEFGDGFAASRMRGSEHNDPWGPEGPRKNGAGGINGGLSNGGPIIFRVAVKPTSSIAAPQKTWNFAKKKEDILQITGRHDVCFALRTPVVVEAMTAIVLADLL